MNIVVALSTPAHFRPLSTTTDSASKHATQAFFDCLRAEMEEANIKVTVISPGYIHTNLSVNAVTADGSRYGGRSGFSPSSVRATA
jgi:NAD(P)-dependent dehydrogenase (short-subunit alcohol dehydrogenase family)